MIADQTRFYGFDLGNMGNEKASRDDRLSGPTEAHSAGQSECRVSAARPLPSKPLQPGGLPSRATGRKVLVRLALRRTIIGGRA